MRCFFPYEVFASNPRFDFFWNRIQVFWIRVVLWRISPAQRLFDINTFARAGIRGPCAIVPIEVFRFRFTNFHFLLIGLFKEPVALSILPTIQKSVTYANSCFFAFAMVSSAIPWFLM